MQLGPVPALLGQVTRVQVPLQDCEVDENVKLPEYADAHVQFGPATALTGHVATAQVPLQFRNELENVTFP